MTMDRYVNTHLTSSIFMIFHDQSVLPGVGAGHLLWLLRHPDGGRPVRWMFGRSLDLTKLKGTERPQGSLWSHFVHFVQASALPVFVETIEDPS